VAGDKAFDWKLEFPKVFEKGGFDVVIGNPPYVRQELLGDMKPYFENHYKSYAGTADLFTYFYEKGVQLINPSGLLSFITNDYNKTKSSTTLRKFLKENTEFIAFDDFSEVDVFQGTTTYPVILTLSFQKKDTFKYCKYVQNDVANIQLAFNENAIEVKQASLDDNNWTFKSETGDNLFQKITDFPTIKSLRGKCFFGVKTGLNEAFITFENYELGEHVKQLYEGKDLKKWSIPKSEKKLIIFKSKFTKGAFGELNAEIEALQKIQSKYPVLIQHLLAHEVKAKKRFDKGDFWWELRNCAYYNLFENPKIVFPNLQNNNKFSFDESGAYINAPAVILPTNDKALLAILNSKLIWYFLNQICVVRSGGYIEVKPQYFEQIPIADYSKNKADFKNKTEKQIGKTNTIHTKIARFLKRLTDNLNIEKPSKKLESFYKYDFKMFVSELKKKKVILSLTQQDEWEDYFKAYKTEINTLQAEINQIDREIDKMVYELYGLTEDEIKIVESA
jgi:hypothetical protein